MKQERICTLSPRCGAPTTSAAGGAWPVAGGREQSPLARLRQWWRRLFRRARAEEPAAPDPAAAVIAAIAGRELRELVRELHYRTPASLKTMREACASCFSLPDDCAYVDYSIPDVNKAIRRIEAHPALAADPERVIGELDKVNGELSYHLREHFGLDHK